MLSLVVLGLFEINLSLFNLASLFFTEDAKDAKSESKKSVWWKLVLGIFSSSSLWTYNTESTSSSLSVYTVSPAAVKLRFYEFIVNADLASSRVYQVKSIANYGLFALFLLSL